MTRDLVGEIWEERPEIVNEKVWILKACYAGEDTGSKIKRVRERMKEEGADACVLASLCDIAWLLRRYSLCASGDVVSVYKDG